MSSSLYNRYRKLFLDGFPLIDLRAPKEFKLGAFPSAVNLPLMNDLERAQVGTCYKTHGQTEAITLGHNLVSGKVKNQRVKDWKAFVEKSNKPVTLYCFRGGLRSKISQQWLKDVGVDINIVEGGYKGLRRFLIDELSRIIGQSSLFLLTGYTGSAKTKLLKQYSFAIDLEALANHRGSSFGKRLTEQPGQIDFENQIAIELIKNESRLEKCVLLEDEGRMIGARSVPLPLKYQMDSAPLILIEESLDFRIEQIFQDYVVSLSQEFDSFFGEQGLMHYSDFLHQGCQKIAKRLGGANTKIVTELIDRAISSQGQTAILHTHKDWIRFLLKNYYDPMYRYQIAKKQARILVRGDFTEVAGYLDQISS